MRSRERVDGTPVGGSELILHVPAGLVLCNNHRHAGRQIIAEINLSAVFERLPGQKGPAPEVGATAPPAMRRVELLERMGLFRESDPIMRRSGAGQRRFLKDALDGISEPLPPV